jgi:hypothetical protein
VKLSTQLLSLLLLFHYLPHDLQLPPHPACACAQCNELLWLLVEWPHCRCSGLLLQQHTCQQGCCATAATEGVCRAATRQEQHKMREPHHRVEDSTALTATCPP